MKPIPNHILSSVIKYAKQKGVNTDNKDKLIFFWEQHKDLFLTYDKKESIKSLPCGIPSLLKNIDIAHKSGKKFILIEDDNKKVVSHTDLKEALIKLEKGMNKYVKVPMLLIPYRLVNEVMIVKIPNITKLSQTLKRVTENET